MKDIPDNIVAERHEISGKWCFMYLTDEQAEKCFHALKPSYSLGKKIATRSPEMIGLMKMEIGHSVEALNKETAHRMRVYLSRIFGTGSGAYRFIDGRYFVTRIK